jgi:hypothetical protein
MAASFRASVANSESWIQSVCAGEMPAVGLTPVAIAIRIDGATPDAFTDTYQCGVVEARRVGLTDLPTEQGPPLAIAVALAWGLAWCFRKVADAIDETDGTT